MLKDANFYLSVCMKKQQEYSTHKTVLLEHVLQISSVLELVESYSQVFRHSLTLYLVGGDQALAFRKNPVIPKSHCESGHLVWALTRRLAREARQTVLSTLGGDCVNTTDCAMQ